MPIPDGGIAHSAKAAYEIAEGLGCPVMVKAQALVGGRGKAGGIVFADTPRRAAEETRRLLGASLKGVPIACVLIECAQKIARETYLGLTIDRSARRLALIVSSEGGIDIEETARAHPDKLQTFLIDPLIGLRPYQVTRAAAVIGLPRASRQSFGEIARSLYRTAQETDARLAEVNPLVVTDEDKLVAVDAKMVIDDSALYRHSDLLSMRASIRETSPERQAREAGISYVKLDGPIGCMVNGAGLAMATMDVIKLYGGKPANFLDIGGGARAERVATAMQIVLSDPNVAAVLINILGGITRCDEVARGVVEALAQMDATVPIVARLAGTNEEEGRRILREAHLTTADAMSEGAQMAIAALAGGR